jgi:monoamine oxidase
VQFGPPLPAWKEVAIRNIEMGQAVKVALLFRSAFWEVIQQGRLHDAAFFRCEGQPFTAYWTQLPLRSTLVMAWAGGPKAVALSGFAEAELVEQAANGFAQLLGEPALVREQLELGVSHDWSKDVFAQGAYSYVAVNGGDARAKLAMPIDGTLFFAGEACASDGQGGTVNGALATGERAAREILASLGNKR